MLGRRRRRTESLDLANAETERLNGDAGRAELGKDVVGEQLKLTRPHTARHSNVEDASLEPVGPRAPSDSRPDRALPLKKWNGRTLGSGRQFERERSEGRAEFDRFP